MPSALQFEDVHTKPVIEDESFYKRYHPLATELSKIAMSILGKQDIDDYTQDALEYILTEIKKSDVEKKPFTPDSRFKNKTIAYILSVNSTGIQSGPELTEEVLEVFPNAVASSRSNESPEKLSDLNALSHEIEELLKKLNPRYAGIIKKLYGIGDEPPMSRSELATAYGISEQRVQQIHNKIIDILQRPQNIRKLTDFR